MSVTPKQKGLFYLALAFAFCLVSAVALSVQVFETRLVQAKVAKQQSELLDVQTQRRLLFLEKSAFASKEQLQKVAKQTLDMKVPKPSEIEVMQ